MAMTLMPAIDDTVGLLMLYEEPAAKLSAFFGAGLPGKEYYLAKLTTDERIEYEKRLASLRLFKRIVWSIGAVLVLSCVITMLIWG